MTEVLEKLRSELKNLADAKTKESLQRFFKDDIKLYGVKMPTVNQIAKASFPKEASKQEIFDLSEELFKSGYIEESLLACDWIERVHKKYEKTDIEIFQSWIEKYVNNWATCDTFCNHSVAELVEKYPEHIERLKKWAKSENRWAKRASAVTLIIPARKGLFLSDIFEIADNLLLDSDDMVQKGCGWMLKAASQANQAEVFEYVMKNKKVMPRTALRYAIEKMPEDLRKSAMEK